MGIIKSAVGLVNEAVLKLREYQSGKVKPIKTRYTHFNENSLGGILSGMIVTIAGISGSGKTYLLQNIENDIFNKELNPDCDDYVLLRCNWEMTVFRLLLRKIKDTLNRPVKSILFNQVDDDDIPKFKDVCNSERNPNIFYMQEPTDPKTWYENVRGFLTTHKDKKQVVISIDHIALVRDIFGSKKKAMDELIEYINLLKSEFTNVSFILISQLNREIEGRTDTKHLAPKRSDLYNTDTLFQISDLVLVIHNPFKLGHEKYMVVSGIDNKHPDTIRYGYLADYMIKPGNKTTSFATYNSIFYHYLKIREIDDMDNIKDIYIEEIYKDRERKASVYTLPKVDEENFDPFR